MENLNRRESFSSLFDGKTVLVTGDSGFKGSWLCLMMTLLGTRVIGCSIDPPTQPSLYELIHLYKLIEHFHCDIRQVEDVKQLFALVRPQFVFHLAARPLVIESYAQPYETYETNILGLLNVLEAAGYALAATLIKNDMANILPSLQIGSTYQFDAVAPAAALKVLEILKSRQGIAHLWNLGNAFINGLNEIINQYSFNELVEAQSWMWSPMPFVWFKPNQLKHMQNFYSKLLQNGIILHPTHMNFISVSHTTEDIDYVLHVCETIMKDW